MPFLPVMARLRARRADRGSRAQEPVRTCAERRRAGQPLEMDLKLVKRQMYGRAGLDLLKARLLGAV